jgi:hypothetical protein
MKKLINTENKVDVENEETTDGGQEIIETETASSSTSEIVLPPEVTPEPRNDEELHLDIFKDNPEGIFAYLPVSDDNGEVLGDTDLEQQVKACCQQYSNSTVQGDEELAKVIEELKTIATKYTLTINGVDNTLSGILAKYRIRQGNLFNILKKMVKEAGFEWVTWFKRNFSGREFRTVQDYMRLAKIPGIIRYAFLGKERLLQVAIYLKEFGKEAKDPVGDFFIKYIVFNPKEEIDIEELKIKTDIAINHQRCIQAGLDEITLDMIESLVRNGKEIEPKFIKELQVRKEAGQDIVADFIKIIAADGRFKPFETPQRNAAWFKSTANKFISAVQDAIKKPEYRNQLDVELIIKLKRMVLELEQQVQASMPKAADDIAGTRNLSIN